MSNITQTEVLEKAENAFKNVRVSILKAAEYLNDVKTLGAWEGKYSSFGEFCESGCGISQSFAAKLCKAFDYWVLQAKVPRSELQDIPAESLYLAISLPGNDEDKLLKARTLSRKEIQEELAVKDGREHMCNFIEICTICSKRR